MHLEATCDLRDREQLNLVAVPIAEQLEDSLSDAVHELQVESRRHSHVISGVDLERTAGDLGPGSPGRLVPLSLYGIGAYRAFLPHTVCPCFATVKPPTSGHPPGGLTLVARVPGTSSQ